MKHGEGGVMCIVALPTLITGAIILYAAQAKRKKQKTNKRHFDQGYCFLLAHQIHLRMSPLCAERENVAVWNGN